MKYKFKRLIALSLSVLTLVTSIPITSYATQAGTGGGIGTGDNTSSSTGASGNGSFDDNKIGIRFTLVDTNGNIVSQNRGLPASVDVSWFDLESLALRNDCYFTNCKMDTIKTYFECSNLGVNKQTNKIISVNKLMESINIQASASGVTSTSMVKYFRKNGKVYTGQGDKFKQWMLGNNVIIDHDKPVGSGGGGTSTGGKPSTGTGNGTGTKPPKRDNVNNSKPTDRAVRLKRSIDAACSSAVSIYSQDYMRNSNFYRNLTNWKNFEIGLIKDWKNRQGLISNQEYLDLMNKVSNTYNDIKKKYRPESKRVASGKNNSLLGEIVGILRSGFEPMTSYASSIKGTTPEKVPEAPKDKEDAWVSDKAYGIFLINAEVNGKYVFELANVGSGKSYDTPLKACSAEGYILLAEPIYAYIPRSASKPIQNFSGGYVIGTATSFSQGMCLLRNKGLWTWKSSKSDVNNRISNRTAPRAMYTPNEFVRDGFKIVVPTEENLGGWQSPGSENAIPFENMTAQNKVSGEANAYVGFGLHLYTFGSGGGTHSDLNTWDQMNYFNSDGPSEDPSTKLAETEFKERSKTFKIVKYYQIKQRPSEEIEPVNYYVALENPHTISINDEVKGNGYKLKDWFTSTTDWTPPDNGDPIDYKYSESKKEYNNGKYDGAGESKLEIKLTDKEVVLHILLEYEPELPVVDTVDVVKIYETNGVTDKVKPKEEVVISDGVYPVTTPEEGYDYKEATTSPDMIVTEPSGWEEVPKDNQTTLKDIPVTQETSTIYIRYEKGAGENGGAVEVGTEKIVLHENEISHNYSMGSLVNELVELNYSFPNESNSGGSTHTRHRENDDEEWTCSWRTVLNDGDYLINVVNAYDYNGTSFIGGSGEFAGKEVGEVSTSDENRQSSLHGFDTEGLKPNYEFILYRDKAKDLVTLYPNKNNGDVRNRLSLLGITSESSIPAHTRVGTTNGGHWMNGFKTNYNYTDNSDFELSYGSTGCSSHGSSGTYDGTPNIGLDEFNSYYSKDGSVRTNYYLGNANIGDKLVAASANEFSIFGKSYNTHISSKVVNDKMVSFYPYIKMHYQVLEGGDEPAYITSENLSKIRLADRVEVGLYKSKSANGLQLESTQWSTHNKTLTGLVENKVDDTQSVLPGGAASTLSTNKNGVSTHIGIRTYQTVIDDSLKPLVVSDSQILTVSEANSQYDSFKAQAKDILEHYQIVQWVTKGIEKIPGDVRSSGTLVSGIGKSDEFAGQTLASDSKYYLKTDGNGADRSDLDILSEESKRVTWKIFSDTDGNVIVTKDGNEISRINKTQGADVLLSNTEINEINIKTKLVENYVKAIDRNLGSDRGGNKWYNEAFDGITVISNEWDIEIGFGGSTPVRGSILDTKLCGSLTDRRDLYNFNKDTLDEKVRTSVFLTSARSTSTQASGKPVGYIGSLGDMMIGFSGIEGMFVSKVFYIPNATVTDLN